MTGIDTQVTVGCWSLIEGSIELLQLLASSFVFSATHRFSRLMTPKHPN